MAFSWTDKAIATLRGLWDEGLSTREIGRRMGINKNSVVGKAARLNLPPRFQKGSPRTGRKPYAERVAITEANKARMATGPGVAAPPRPPEPVTILRAHRFEPCCAPIGTPGMADFRYCDLPTSGRYRAPYCDFHAAQFLRVRVSADAA